MRRSQLLLCLAVFALSACSSDSPASPHGLGIGSPQTPVMQSFTGVLELTADDEPRYAVRLGNDVVVLLIVDNATMDVTMVGDQVLASGRFAANGEFIVERLQRIVKIPD